ncbi:MAG: hypothetical protein RI890_774, partial [Actinomycetota bacterium]
MAEASGASATALHKLIVNINAQKMHPFWDAFFYELDK